MTKKVFRIDDFSTVAQEIFRRANSSQRKVLEEKLLSGFEVDKMDVVGTILIHEGFYYIAITTDGTCVPC